MNINGSTNNDEQHRCSDIHPIHKRLVFSKWSWRESNPRPNRETIRFLHAYLGLHCRTVTRPKPPITALSSKTSSLSRGSQETISDNPAPLYLPDSEQHLEERCLVLSPCKRIKPVIYCTSIRQRERTLFRQLIFRPT